MTNLNPISNLDDRYLDFVDEVLPTDHFHLVRQYDTTTIKTQKGLISTLINSLVTDPTIISELTIGRIEEPGNPSTAQGKVIIIGEGVGVPEAINTAGVIGDGAPNYENVIGGLLASVNTAVSNIPPEGPGTGLGSLSDEDGSWVWIIGGYDNVVNGWACIVLGFHNKIGSGANHITISGGSIQSVADEVVYGTIAGGTINSISAGADYSTISGGAQNTVSAIYGTVGGGLTNDATARSATVSGGENNDATATYTTIGGGLTNTATANAATVAGGQSNVASGASSLVAGRDNQATVENTVATGRQALASIFGSRVHAAGAFATRGDAQHITAVLRNTTTTNTQTTLFTNGVSEVLAVPADTTWAFSILVVGRRTDVDGEGAAYKIEGVVDRHTLGSSIAFIGTPTITVLGEDNVSWDCDVFANTTGGSLSIRVTGENSKTIRWVAVADIIAVTG